MKQETVRLSEKPSKGLKKPLGRAAFTLLISSIVALILSGCGSTPAQPDTVQTTLSVTEQVKQLTQTDSETASSSQNKLAAVELLLNDEKNELATSLLATIDTTDLSGDDYARYTLLTAQIALTAGKIEDAVAALYNVRLNQNMHLIAMSLQLEISELRARTLALKGSHLASVQERIYIHPLLAPEKAEYNQSALWLSLNTVALAQLQSAAQTSITGDYQGWLELAIASKENQESLDKQIAAIDDWLVRWPNHPATAALPEDVTLIREAAHNRPQKIAILLPLSGKLKAAGNAILDGIMTAFYRLDKTQYSPEIMVLNTERQATEQAYQQAVNLGAEFVIGPLDKTKIRELFDLGDLPVPVLALNSVDNYGQPPSGLYQFGLSLNDEIDLIARTARLENRKHALALVPDANWGDKALNAFKQIWQENGGDVVAEAKYNNDELSKTVKEIFEIELSNQRIRDARRITGLDLKYEPRRRQDMDMIFLVARPEQARSLNPLFDFHYASDLPVYATSHLHTLNPQEEREKDLNGIKFAEIPWLTNQLDDAAMAVLRPQLENNAFVRLYALGLDAFYIHPRVRQLAVYQNSYFYGRSGKLSLDQQNHINRQLSWATYQYGKVKPLPILQDTDDQKE